MQEGSRKTMTLFASSVVFAKSEIEAQKDRMETDAAKKLYRARAGLCEWTNAQFAGRFDMRQFLVRGVEKATSVALLAAITSNLTQHLATLATLAT